MKQKKVTDKDKRNEVRKIMEEGQGEQKYSKKKKRAKRKSGIMEKREWRNFPPGKEHNGTGGQHLKRKNHRGAGHLRGRVYVWI